MKIRIISGYFVERIVLRKAYVYLGELLKFETFKNFKLFQRSYRFAKSLLTKFLRKFGLKT